MARLDEDKRERQERLAHYEQIIGAIEALEQLFEGVFSRIEGLQSGARESDEQVLLEQLSTEARNHLLRTTSYIISCLSLLARREQLTHVELTYTGKRSRVVQEEAEPVARGTATKP